MINLYEILQTILHENVTPQDVTSAIDDKIQVIINYSDEKNRAPKKRLIEPYAYGLSSAGNEVLRAYQYEGDTYRGKPKWKLFRLDRIKSWNPTEQHFNAQPKERGWNAPAYNETGDNTMSQVLHQVTFDYDTTSDNPYVKGSKPYQIRKQSDNISNSKPIHISQMIDNQSGPVKNDNIPQQNVKSDFQKMLDRNLAITQKEKEKRGFSLSKPQENPRGPIINNDVQNDNTEVNNNVTNNEQPKTIDDVKSDFQKMLDRNLAITQKEKEKRGFSLSKPKK